MYKNLNLKETDELLEIWITNDRVEWSDTAFDVIKDLLTERIGLVPPQHDPILQNIEDNDGGLDDWEARLLDEEDQPVFYDTLEVLSLRDNINRVANVAVVVYILIGLLNIPWLSSILLRGSSITLFDAMEFGVETLITILTLGIRVALIYFSLKALTHILRILMEMEFRSRKGIKSNSVVSIRPSQ
jgi:hypothetical protein